MRTAWRPPGGKGESERATIAQCSSANGVRQRLDRISRATHAGARLDGLARGEAQVLAEPRRHDLDADRHAVGEPGRRPRAPAARAPATPSVSSTRATLRSVRAALSRSKPTRVGRHRAHRREHQRHPLEEQLPLARQARALRRARAGASACARSGASAARCAHRGADAVVAVALEIRLLEVAELGHEHLEPQLAPRAEARRLRRRRVS